MRSLLTLLAAALVTVTVVGWLPRRSATADMPDATARQVALLEMKHRARMIQTLAIRLAARVPAALASEANGISTDAGRIFDRAEKLLGR